MSVDPTITFHGAAGGVTGSCFLVRYEGGSLLVDCGLFQGSKTVQELNYRDFPFDVSVPQALVLTHAHIDHSGLIPKLYRHGFQGPVIATRGTADLLTFMLPDSGHIQETEVRRLNFRNRQRGRAQVQPIYTRADAERVLDRIRPVDRDVWVDVLPGVRARFWDAGHILGSASVELELPGADGPVIILFSGDLGPGDKPFHPPPAGPHRPDWLVVESTYGGRDRPVVDAVLRRQMLATELQEAFRRGGPVIIPAFAVERTQELLYDLDLLFDEGALPTTQVFLDSPLAVNVTRVFDRNLPDINQPGTPPPFSRRNLHMIEDVEGSKRLNRLTGNVIIIAASGMCEAGRIRHHLKNNLWRQSATVLLVGYQAPATLGRLLQEGVANVRIHGEEVAVQATIRTLDAYSGHADRGGLMRWTLDRLPVSGGIFVVHGEDQERVALRSSLMEAGIDGAKIHIPDLDQSWALTDRGARTTGTEKAPPPRLPRAAQSTPDWHNSYAATVLSLADKLRSAGSDTDRAALLERVRKALSGA
ncbi:MBL fold metallo-hydrolase [Niveispirillum irakense]|uniref:MBL fold metallo-hydrolase n=1 Tax=Niveispirillum irakense TaxID=34011 RepID=UPI00040CBF9C|nr:MBL fold metallo-hydrolase [Niveispirillum irakense]